MTMKEMFKKIEAYNDIADLMRSTKAKISLEDGDGCCRQMGRFSNYEEFSKFVKHEYIKEVADKLLKYDNWDVDKEITFSWTGGVCKFAAYLIAA